MKDAVMKEECDPAFINSPQNIHHPGLSTFVVLSEAHSA
jgi:hypothetical protein